MVRTYAIKPAVVFLLPHVTELRHVGGAALRGLESQRVGHANVVDGSGKQFRMLGDGATDGDAAGAGASNRQMRGRRIPLLNQVLSRGDHVVDGVLLGLLLARLMP